MAVFVSVRGAEAVRCAAKAGKGKEGDTVTVALSHWGREEQAAILGVCLGSGSHQTICS